MEDNLGLQRTVLSYLDIGKQPVGKYTLIIDEAMGRSMFACDGVDVYKHEVVAYRVVRNETETVTRFSPLLPWRVIDNRNVYLTDTKTILAQEYEASKLTREYIKELRGPDEPDVIEEPEVPHDYRPGNYA